MANTHQYLDIIIQDDMKYDIRIENAEMERYLLYKPLWVLKHTISDISLAASFTDSVTQMMS